jgi:hypothetical protein
VAPQLECRLSYFIPCFSKNEARRIAANIAKLPERGADAVLVDVMVWAVSVWAALASVAVAPAAEMAGETAAALLPVRCDLTRMIRRM